MTLMAVQPTLRQPVASGMPRVPSGSSRTACRLSSLVAVLPGPDLPGSARGPRFMTGLLRVS
jgi:hypothetical protein